MSTIFFSVIILSSLAVLLLGSVPAYADTITVTANPLWTKIGTLSLSSTVTISGASGIWDWGNAAGPPTGPDGDPPASNVAFSSAAWITGGRQGQLIGFVGPSGLDLSSYSGVSPHRVITQDDPRLFVVGTGTIVLTNLQGTLFLGMNDDYHPDYIYDNSGTCLTG